MYVCVCASCAIVHFSILKTLSLYCLLCVLEQIIDILIHVNELESIYFVTVRAVVVAVTSSSISGSNSSRSLTLHINITHW